MQWGQLAQFMTGGGVVAGLFQALGWWVQRRKTASEANRGNAEAAKLSTESRIAESADYRQWAERADKRAERAEERLDAAEADAREAKARASALQADLDAARDELADVHRRLDAFLAAVRECAGGRDCPVSASLRD